MNRTRGFTLIVVAVIVVIVTALVVGVVSAMRSERLSAIRAREEARARAIAEGCVDRMFATATTYIKEVQAASNEPPPDFDGLLDPDGRRDTGDEFIPRGSAAVSVPPRSTAAAHRHGLIRVDGGACLIRFEDNSDDWHPGLGDKGTGNSGVVEGPAAGDEVPDRDRDRSIWVSVIGVFPALDGTADADVWTRAHARVPIRRFLETAGGPAIWAGDEVTIQNGGVAVCGLGGIVSEDIDRPDNVCACGHQKHGDIDDAIRNECDYTNGAGDFCDDRTRACEPNVRDEAPQPDPVAEVPTPTTFRTLARTDEFGDASAGHGRCGAWLQDVDAFDPANRDRRSHRETTPGLRVTTVNGQTVQQVEGMAYLWVGDAARADTAPIFAQLLGTVAGTTGVCNSTLGATNSACPGVTTAVPCPPSPPAQAPRPCRWVNDDGTIRRTPVCAEVDGERESACWVPVAKLDGRRTMLVANAGGVLGAITAQLRPLLNNILFAPLALLGLDLDALTENLAQGLAGSMIGIGEMTVVTKPNDPRAPCNPDVETCVERVAFQRHRPELVVGPVLGATLRLSSTGLRVSVGGLNLGPVGLGPLGGVVGTVLNEDAATSIDNLCGGGCTGPDDCVDDPSFFVDRSAGFSRFHTDIAFADKRLLPTSVTWLVENLGHAPERDRLIVDVGIPATAAERVLKTPVKAALRASGDLEMVRPAALCCPTCVCPHGPGATVDELPRRRFPNDPPRPAGLDCDVHAATRWVTSDSGGLRNVLAADGGCRLHGGSTVLGQVRCGNVSMRPGSVVGDPRRELGGCFVGGIDGRARCPDGRPCPERGDPHLIDDCTGRTSDDTTVDGVDLRIADCDDDGLCVPHSVGIVGNLRSATDVCLGPNVTVFDQVVGLDDVAIARDVVVNHDNAGSLGAVTQAQAWFEGLP